MVKCATKYCRNEAAKNRKVCHKCKSRRDKETNPIQYHFNALRNNARRRGKDFKLTKKDFENFDKETGYMELKGKTGESLSIDRIRNEEGYTADNLQALPLAENSAKGTCPF